MTAWGVVGYRHFDDYDRLCRELTAVARLYGVPDRVVSGGATGADALAERWAREQKVPLTVHKPKAFTAKELLARNTLIVRDSAIVVAFVHKDSRGTWDTVRKARKAKRIVIVVPV